MSIKKYTDWRNWFNGIIDSAIPAGATAFLTLVTTNGLASMGGVMSGIGMSWKTAIAQIVVHMGIATAKYLQTKPRPEVVTETVDTTFSTKQPDGSTVEQSSKTVTTTPVAPAEPPKPTV